MKSKTKLCPYCKQFISTKKHLFKCNPTVSIEQAFIDMIEITYKCDINDIVKDYNDGYSLPDIKRKFGLSYKMTIDLLNIENVKTRSISDSCKLNSKKEKTKKTLLEKYGVDNASKSEEIKQKKRDTFTKNYGVDNIFKTDGFNSYINNLMIKKYGKKRITNPKLISETRLKFSQEKWKNIHEKTKNTIQQRYSNQNDNFWKYISDLERNVCDILDENDIKYEIQKFIEGRSFDIYILNTNILIEINGDYWHCNPEFYKEGDKINYSGKGVCKVEEIWERDIVKRIVAENNGYCVIYLWENDINFHIKNNSLDFFVLKSIINLK